MNSLQKVNQLIQREQYLLNQFYHNLQANIRRLTDKENAPTESLAELEACLQGELSWSTANRVELALVDFYDDISLQTEWQRRLAEVGRLPQNLMDFYAEQAEETDKAVLRALLARLVADLQWAVESKRVIRFNENQMRKKVVALFLCAFVLFFLPTICRTLFNVEFDNLRLYYIFTAASSGILGAAFSQLTSIQSRVQLASLDQVRAMSQMGYIVARAMVGAGAGLIMFYLVQSGLLSGAFFPVFIHTAEELAGYQNELLESAIAITKNTYGVSQSIEATLGVGTLAQPGAGMSLLIVWCLLAGFSEKMIPGILNNKAKQTVDSTAK
ncbi:MAG: hypothetical protein ACI9NY_000008 [Kiritimatiellia bacterium]